MIRPARAARHALIVAALLALLLTVPVLTPRLMSSAQAHAGLVSSSPRDGATISSPPGTIELTFSDDVAPEFAAMALTVDGGPERALVTTGTDDPATVRADLAGAPVASGPWRVNYRVTSADGHPIQGSVRFTVAATPSPAAGATAPSAGTSDAPPSATPSDVPPSAADDPHAGVTPGPSAQEDRPRSLALPAVGLGLVALLAAALLIAGRARRRRSTAP